MPSATYNALVRTVGSYMDVQRAKAVIDRQLESFKLTPDSLSSTNVKDVTRHVSAAAKLYVTDPAKRAEMMDSIKAI